MTSWPTSPTSCWLLTPAWTLSSTVGRFRTIDRGPSNYIHILLLLASKYIYMIIFNIEYICIILLASKYIHLIQLYIKIYHYINSFGITYTHFILFGIKIYLYIFGIKISSPASSQDKKFRRALIQLLASEQVSQSLSTFSRYASLDIKIKY